MWAVAREETPSCKVDEGAWQQVYGITVSQAEGDIASPHLLQVIIDNIETMHLDFSEGFFDAILLSNLLEQVVDPRSTLTCLRKYLRSGVACLCMCT